jgi:hypothetical protein
VKKEKSYKIVTKANKKERIGCMDAYSGPQAKAKMAVSIMKKKHRGNNELKKILCRAIINSCQALEI